MTDITDSFQELKRLFAAECIAVEKIKEECHEARPRPAASYIITKLLHGFSVKEAYRINNSVHHMIGEACEGSKLDTGKIHPTFTVIDYQG